MTMAVLLCAIMTSALTPMESLPHEGIKEAYVYHVENCVVVSVLSDAEGSYSRKKSILREYAESLAEEVGLPVILTEDMRTHMILCRIQRRGPSEYERRNLASRLKAIYSDCIQACPNMFDGEKEDKSSFFLDS